MSEPSAGLLRVCVVATPVGDDADRALDALLQMVAHRLPHEATRAWKAADEAAPSFAELHRADVLLVCARRMPLDGEALARVQWYCQRGRPLVALRAGGGPTFARWPKFDSDVLGIEAAGIVATATGPLVVRPRGGPHPILTEVSLSESYGSLPRGICLADDSDVFVEARSDSELEPVAWTRSRGAARLFATTLGQSGELAAPAFAVLVGNALRWVTSSPRPA